MCVEASHKSRLRWLVFWQQEVWAAADGTLLGLTCCCAGLYSALVSLDELPHPRHSNELSRAWCNWCRKYSRQKTLWVTAQNVTACFSLQHLNRQTAAGHVLVYELSWQRPTGQSLGKCRWLDECHVDLTEGRRVLRMQRQHLRDNDKANVTPGTGGASPEGAYGQGWGINKKIKVLMSHSTETG